MEAECDIREITNHGVVHLDSTSQPLFQCPALFFVEGSCAGFKRQRIMRRIELDVRYTQLNQLGNLLSKMPTTCARKPSSLGYTLTERSANQKFVHKLGLGNVIFGLWMVLHARK